MAMAKNSHRRKRWCGFLPDVSGSVFDFVLPCVRVSGIKIMAGYDDEEYAQYGSSYDDGKFSSEIPVNAGTSSQNFQNGVEVKPRVLLMGLKKSGKSSIQKVVFQKMSPNETLFLESTTKLIKSGMPESFLPIPCYIDMLISQIFPITLSFNFTFGISPAN